MKLRGTHFLALAFPGATALCASCDVSEGEATTTSGPADAAPAPIPCPDAFVAPGEQELDGSKPCGAQEDHSLGSYELGEPTYRRLAWNSFVEGGELPPGVYSAVYSHGNFHVRERLVMTSDGRFTDAYDYWSAVPQLGSGPGPAHYLYYSSGRWVAQDAKLALHSECDVTTNDDGYVVFVGDGGTLERPYRLSSTCEQGFLVEVVDIDKTEVYLQRR